MTAYFDRNIFFLTSLTKTRLRIAISSLKNSDDYFYSSTLNTAFSTTFTHLSTTHPIHYCKNTLSSLHILVHHCTFCASLHVKTSPGLGDTALLSIPFEGINDK